MPKRPCGPNHPSLGIGSGSVIEGAIVDKNCRIGSHVRVVNEQGIDNGEGLARLRDSRWHSGGGQGRRTPRRLDAPE